MIYTTTGNISIEKRKGIYIHKQVFLMECIVLVVLVNNDIMCRFRKLLRMV